MKMLLKNDLKMKKFKGKLFLIPKNNLLMNTFSYVQKS